MKFVEIPFPVMADAVERGTVVGAVPVEPFLTLAIERGLRLIRPTNGIARSYVTSGWVATRAWAQTHQDVATRLVGAIYEAGRWANRNHAASIPILSKYTKVPGAIIARMHRGTFAESTNEELAQPVIAAAVTYGLLAQVFPAAELYDRG